MFARTPADTVHAVDDVTFNVERGDVFGLVGESGSGKTTTGRVTAGLMTDRATGYDASSGSFVENIPHSFLTLSGEVGIMVVHPYGSYRVILTPLGSGPYHLLVSKEFNINSTKYSRVLDGTVNAIAPEQFLLNSDTMSFISEGNYGRRNRRFSAKAGEDNL